MDESFPYFIILFLLTLLSFKLFSNRKYRTNQTSAKLPPGSMGWPYIGQTLPFYSQDPNVFFFTKQKRLLQFLKLCGDCLLDAENSNPCFHFVKVFGP